MYGDYKINLLENRVTTNLRNMMLAVTASAAIDALIVTGVHPTVHYVALLMVLMGAVFIDLVSGVIKSIVVDKQGIISGKLKRTAIKIAIYSMVVVGSFFISYIVASTHEELSNLVKDRINSFSVTFLIYIELVSICENLIAADRDGYIATILKPLHLLLQFRLKGAMMALFGKEYKETIKN